jgi:hypothetical protein
MAVGLCATYGSSGGWRGGHVHVDAPHYPVSSKRARRRRACGHKHKHATCEDAMRHVRHLRLMTGAYYLPYRCSFCGQWHVGRPSKRIVQAIAERRRRAR